MAGFTLVELVIVITIAGVLAMIALPSFQGIINNMRMGSAQSLLQNDLNHARAEAIKRNLRVIVCVRNSAGSACDTNAGWASGWVVCSEDVAIANQCSGVDPLVVRPPLNATLTLAAQNAATGTDAKVVRFNANSSQGADGSWVVFSVGGTWSGATARTVTVQGTGHVQISR